MRYGLISDVHANLHALRAVLAALRGEDVDRVVCAGDLVGYGAFPNECVELLLDGGVRCVAGNHDLMAIGRLSIEGAPIVVQRTQGWTRGELSDSVRSALEALPIRGREGPMLVTHGSLASPTRYVRSTAEMRSELAAMAAEVADADFLVLGHTHFQRVVAESGGGALRRGSAELGGGRYVINPGSVGQSRQWEPVPRARFAILDTVSRHVVLRAVDYDRAAARRALRERGLPESAIHSPRSVRRAVWRRMQRVGRGVYRRR